MGDPVSEAAIAGAALVRHLDDVRFACLRALRQLLRALDAERIAIAFVSPDGKCLREELVWAGGFARCGESERVLSSAGLAEPIRDWLASRNSVVNIPIEVQSPAWHAMPCDRLVLVRGELVVKGLGLLVLAVQLRSAGGLPEGAGHAMSLFLNEYGKRRWLITS